MQEKENVNIAKKLLEFVLKKARLRERYEDVLYKMALEIRREIMKTYGCKKEDIFGVFGKDDIFVFRSGKKEIGKRLIPRISRALCKEFRKVVITGERVYNYRRDKIKTERSTVDKIVKRLKEKDESMWRTAFSKTLGYIPWTGIFLIDAGRSASVHEEGSFHGKKEGPGIGVIVSHKLVRQCKGLNLKTVKIGNLKYHQCLGSDFKKCLMKNSKCFSKKLNINATTIEPFINRKSHSLIFIEDLRNIEKTITKFYEIDYSK